MPTYTPFFCTREFEKLIRYAFDGSLNGIVSGGIPVIGVQGLDRTSYGFKSQSLLQRFTREEVLGVVAQMAREPEPMPTYATLVVFKNYKCIPLEYLAKIDYLGFRDSSHAQGYLGQAQEEIMRRLL